MMSISKFDWRLSNAPATCSILIWLNCPRTGLKLSCGSFCNGKFRQQGGTLVPGTGMEMFREGGGGLMVSEITHIVTSQVPSGTSKPASLLRLVVVHYYYPGLCSHAETDRG